MAVEPTNSYVDDESDSTYIREKQSILLGNRKAARAICTMPCEYRQD